MTRNNKIVLGVVLAAAALAAYWMLLLSPKRQEASDLGAQVTQKQQSVDAAETMVSQYAKQRDAYKVNYATLVRLGKAVPGDDDIRSLMVQIDDAAHSSGVDFRTIDVGGGGGAPTVGGGPGVVVPPGAVPVGAGGFSAMPFKFTFIGRFDNLGGFFSRLERFVTVQEDKVRVTGRLMRVESITLAPGPSGYPQIQATVSASSYLAPIAKGVSGGSTAAAPVTTPGTTGGATTTTTTATATGALR